GAAPRRVNLLAWSGAGFTANELGGELDAIAVAAFRANALDDYYIVVLGEPEGTVHPIEFGRISRCNEYDVLGRFDTEFPWRTLDAPEEFTDPFLPKRNGMKFVLVNSGEDQLQIAHYDGFTVNVFSFTELD